MTNNTLEKLAILKYDPFLADFESDLNLRMDNYEKFRKDILGGAKDLSAFASGHEYFGIHKFVDDKNVIVKDKFVYREWAPNATGLELVGDFNCWNGENHKLVRLPNGAFEIVFSCPMADFNKSLIKVRVSANGEVFDRIPLYITKTFQDPVSFEYSGQVWFDEKDFKFKNELVLNDEPLLIYECHVGMSGVEEKITSFKEFKENMLPRIKSSGYNTIQIMAIAEHPYYASFGYHISNFFAVSSRFGTPEEFKDLVDTAHGMGIKVLLDLVHSHAVKNTLEGINCFDGTEYQFFHAGEKGEHPAWGSKLFNYSKHEVVHFLLSNIKFWLEEYKVDGFRFDGVTSMIYNNHGLGVDFTDYSKYFSLNTNISAITYLQLANELIHEINKNAITIAEDMSGMPGMSTPIESGGIGFDYRLSMGVPDLWVQILEKYSDENWDLGKIWYELTTRRPQEKNICYCESHDQALVGDKTIIFRLADSEMYFNMSKDSESVVIDRAIALHKLIRFITLTLGGDGYLNFMGNEIGHPEWVDFPREGNDWSYKYAKRQWNLSDDKNLRYIDLLEFDKAMIKLVKNNKSLMASKAELLYIHEDDKILIYRKENLIFLYNFHPHNSYADYFVPFKDELSFRVVFDSDKSIFGGFERIPQDYKYATKSFKRGDGILIYLPSRTVTVLEVVDNV